ncbi:MAG: diguanylate cyclase domain-containing protein [Vibrio sp.]
MNKKSPSNRISTRKVLLLGLILVSLISTFLSVWLLMVSYHDYQNAKIKNTQFTQINSMISALGAIGRERGFANEVIFAKSKDKASAFEALIQARTDTDQHIKNLSPSFFTQPQWDEFKQALKSARGHVDEFKTKEVQTPERSKHAVNAMLSSSKLLHNDIYEAIALRIKQSNNPSVPFLKVLTLAELRDSTGRLAAPFLTSLHFNVPITIGELKNSIRRLERIQVSWVLLHQMRDNLETQKEFETQLMEAEAKYQSRSKPLIEHISRSGFEGEDYHLSADEFSKMYRTGLGDIETLQSNYINNLFILYKKQERQAQAKFVTVIVCLAAIILLLSTIFLYVQRRLLKPLLTLNLSAQKLLKGELDNSRSEMKHIGEIQALFDMFRRLDKQMKKQRRLSMEDPLTHLPNRRKFNLDAQQLIDDAPEQKCLSMSFVDLDFFKKINDTWGHAMGDQVLVAVANILAPYLQENSCVARLGGEEFALLMLTDNNQERDKVLTEIQQKIRALELTNEEGNIIKVTASFGVCSSHTLVSTDILLEDLLEESDKALYEAKESGRDRICYCEYQEK